MHTMHSKILLLISIVCMFFAPNQKQLDSSFRQSPSTVNHLKKANERQVNQNKPAERLTKCLNYIKGNNECSMNILMLVWSTYRTIEWIQIVHYYVNKEKAREQWCERIKIRTELHFKEVVLLNRVFELLNLSRIKLFLAEHFRLRRYCDSIEECKNFNERSRPCFLHWSRPQISRHSILCSLYLSLKLYCNKLYMQAFLPPNRIS